MQDADTKVQAGFRAWLDEKEYNAAQAALLMFRVNCCLKHHLCRTWEAIDEQRKWYHRQPGVLQNGAIQAQFEHLDSKITGCPSATGITRKLGTFGAQCSSASPSEPFRELNHPLDDV